MPAGEFLSRDSSRLGQVRERYSGRTSEEKYSSRTSGSASSPFLNEKAKERIREIANENNGSGKAILLNNSLEEMKSISEKGLTGALRKIREKPYVIIIDGTANQGTINSIEDSGAKILVAKNFTTTDTKIELLSF